MLPKLLSHGVRGLTFACVVLCTQACAESGEIIGKWARNDSECVRPELVFNSTTARIQIDADGAPIAFDYSKVSYKENDHEVVVELFKNHPYGKTASKTSLNFELNKDGTISMLRAKNRKDSFVRCDKTKAK